MVAPIAVRISWTPYEVNALVEKRCAARIESSGGAAQSMQGFPVVGSIRWRCWQAQFAIVLIIDNE